MRDGEDAVDSILSGDTGDFGRISNPYIKEAFKFLMSEAGGKPLSRDELRMLLDMLDDWEESGAPANGRQDPADLGANKVSRNIERLNDLHAVKIGAKGINDIDESVRNSIRGLRVKNLGTDKRNALLQVSRNQRANTSFSAYRVFAETNYQEDVSQILNDENLKDDAPVYFADKTRGNLVCGETDRTRGLSPKKLAQEAAAMREGLLKFAKNELSDVPDGVNTVKLIRSLLLGAERRQDDLEAKWQDDHKILSTPLTKHDLKTISTLVADAKSGDNVYVNVNAEIMPKRCELPLEQQLVLELRMTEIEQEWNRKNPDQLYDGRRIWDLCRNGEYTRAAAILYGDKIEPLCQTRQTPPKLLGNAEVAPPGFEVRNGSAAQVLKDCQDQFQDGATAVWVNGDGSNHGGYNSIGNGQEEDMMCSSSPRVQAAFVGLGLTEPDEMQNSLIKFTRNEAGLVKTPATDGILSETTIDNVDQVKCEKPFKTTFIDFAMPSFTLSSSSTDLSGSVQWQCDCRGLKSDVSAMLPDEQSTTLRDVANSRRLIDRYYLLACGKSWDITDGAAYSNAVEELNKLKTEVGISDDDLNRAGLEKKILPNGHTVTFAMDILKCLVFASEELRAKGVNVHADDTDTQLKNLLTLFKSGDYKDILDAANKNYEATITRKIDKVFAELESRGIKRLVVSAPGGGFFDNDDGVVAKIFAKVAHAHHVDLVYASHKGEAKDVHVQHWKKVFGNPPEGTVGVSVYAPADIGVEEGGQDIGAAVTKALKKVKTGYRRDGYAVAINACSRKLAALRTADSKLKEEYLKFLEEAKGVLEASGTDEEIRANIRKLGTYKALDDNIHDAVAEALAAVDAYLKESKATA